MWEGGVKKQAVGNLMFQSFTYSLFLPLVSTHFQSATWCLHACLWHGWFLWSSIRTPPIHCLFCPSASYATLVKLLYYSLPYFSLFNSKTNSHTPIMRISLACLSLVVSVFYMQHLQKCFVSAHYFSLHI